jgi:hypothetical protein
LSGGEDEQEGTRVEVETLGEATSSGRSIYADYIKAQLDAQEARKASLEQRGLAVIATSGVLVTLLFGLTALSVRHASTFVIPDTASVLLIVARVFFVLAALSAIVTNVPRSYEGVTVAALRGAVTERWHDSEAVASEMVALTRLKMLASAKKNNDAKGKRWSSPSPLRFLRSGLSCGTDVSG